MAVPTAALTRLSAGAPNGYNSGAFNASTNPYGFASGGHILNFPTALLDLQVVADWVVDEVTPLVALAGDIDALGAITASIATVATINTQVVSVAGIASQLTALYGALANVATLAARAADLALLGPRAADLALLADIQDGTTATGAITQAAAAATAIANVSAALTAVNAVHAALSNVNTVAGIAPDVSAAASIAVAITATAANATAITTCASNLAAILAAPTHASNAAASAVTAASQATALRGTSTTSLAIAAGSKVFTTQAGKQWSVGTWLLALSDANPTTHFMFGQVTSYSSTTLTLNVTAVGGSGSRADWTICVSGLQGAPASGSGDTVGAVSSTAGNLPVFADGTGKLLSDSGILAAELFNIATDNLDAVLAGSTNKHFTNTEKTKLADIELGADVTDAANVGAALAGAATKATPVDADGVWLTDSAASNAPKRTLWSAIKATLKTYFDTLYAAVSHTHAFSALSSKPTTLAGYGITDATLRGHFSGLLVTTNLADASHDLDIAIGSAASDASTPALITLSSALTKRGDATFAEGNNAGGFVSGESMPTSGTVHVWLISKADGTTDVCLNNHASSGLTPTLPSGFINKVHVTSRLTDGSGNFLAVTAVGDYVFLNIPVSTGVLSIGTTSSLQTLSIPAGVDCEVLLRIAGNNTSALTNILVSSPYDPDQAPNSPAGNADLTVAASANYTFTSLEVLSNTSRQVRVRASQASTNLLMVVRGWRQTRRWV